VGGAFLEGFCDFHSETTWCFDGLWMVFCGQNVVLCTTFFGIENMSLFLKYFYQA
jgi:hypothetical protein